MTVCRLYDHPEMHAATGETIRPGGLTLTDRAMRICDFSPGARILDVGCGMGTTVAHLRQEFHIRAVGLDPSPSLPRQGTRRRTGLPLLRGRAEALPVGNRTMDGVICECVLSLVEDPRRALLEYNRILNREGSLVASDIYSKSSGLRTVNSGRPKTSCLDGAVSREANIEMVTSAGFRVLLWEDHSRLLAELAGRLIFKHGSLADFRRRIGLPSPEKSDETNCSKPGYYLMIAQKKGNE
jgi:arsenite methyltransferase